MRETLQIERMREEHWKELHDMDVEIFPDDHFDEDWFRKRVQREGCFVLNLNKHIVGYLIVARYGEDGGHLGRIGVARTQQGRGYGSILMKHALNWFRGQGGVRTVHLYTQDFNEEAQSLYRKFGFQRSGTTWHFFVPYESLMPIHEYTCHGIQEDEIEFVGKKFISLPAMQISRFLTYDEFRVLVLKDRRGEIKGACRFTPSFPGCFPFEITEIKCFDDFVLGIKDFGLPEYDYVRITFTDMAELASLCKGRGYHLHHRLFKMTAVL